MKIYSYSFYHLVSFNIGLLLACRPLLTNFNVLAGTGQQVQLPPCAVMLYLLSQRFVFAFCLCTCEASKLSPQKLDGIVSLLLSRIVLVSLNDLISCAASDTRKSSCLYNNFMSCIIFNAANACKRMCSKKNC